MFSQTGRINVSGRKARPSTASMTKPPTNSNHLIPIASNRVVTGGDVTKQLLHIKETDVLYKYNNSISISFLAGISKGKI